MDFKVMIFVMVVFDAALPARGPFKKTACQVGES